MPSGAHHLLGEKGPLLPSLPVRIILIATCGSVLHKKLELVVYTSKYRFKGVLLNSLFKGQVQNPTALPMTLDIHHFYLTYNSNRWSLNPWDFDPTATTGAIDSTGER